MLLSAEAAKAAQKANLENNLETAQHALQDKQQVSDFLVPPHVFALKIFVTPLTYMCCLSSPYSLFSSRVLHPLSPSCKGAE